MPSNYVRLNPPETMDSRLTKLNDRFMRLQAIADHRERSLNEATRYYQFRDSCDQMLQWINDKRRQIADFAATKLPTPPPAEVGSRRSASTPTRYNVSKSVAKEMANFQLILSASFASQSGKLEDIRKNADQMIGEKHPSGEEIVGLRNEVEQEWADLQQIKLEFEQRAQGMSNLELFEQTVNEALEMINRRLSHWDDQMEQCDDPLRQDIFFKNELNMIREREARAKQLAKAVVENYPEETAAVNRRLKQLQDAMSQLDKKSRRWQDRIDTINNTREFEDKSTAALKWLDHTISRLESDPILQNANMPVENRSEQINELENEMTRWVDRLDDVMALGLAAQASGDARAGEIVQEIKDKRDELAELAEQYAESVGHQKAEETFLREANSIETKLKECETVLSVVDIGDSVTDVDKVSRRVKESISNKLALLNDRIEKLQNSADQLRQENHPDSDEFIKRAAALAQLHQKVEAFCEERLKLLSASKDMHQWLADSEEFIEWCEEKIRVIPTNSRDLSNEASVIDSKNAKHEAIERATRGNEKKKDDLIEVGKKMQEFAECDMPSHKQEAVDDCLLRLESVWDELQDAIRKRRQMLDAYVHDRYLQKTLHATEERLRLAESKLANGQEIGPAASADNLRTANRSLQRYSGFAGEMNDDMAYLKSVSQQQLPGRKSVHGAPVISGATERQIDDLLHRYDSLKPRSAEMKRKLEIQKAYYELLIELKIEVEWIEQRMTSVDSTKLGNSLYEAQMQMQRFRQIDLDLKGHDQPLTRLLAKANEVIKETDKDKTPIYNLVSEVESKWDQLNEQANKKRKLLEDVLKIQKCAAEVDDLEQWLGDTERAVYVVEDQTDVVSVNSAAIDRHLNRQHRLTEELEQRGQQLSQLTSTVKSLTGLVPVGEDLPRRLQVVGDKILRLRDRVTAAGNKLEASKTYFQWANETAEFNDWIQMNMQVAMSQDYGHDIETLKALEDKFDEFFSVVEARCKDYDEISRLSEELISKLQAVKNQHLIEQVHTQMAALHETWQGMVGNCARRRSNFAAARVLHQFHQDLDVIQAVIDDKALQISSETGRDLQSVSRLSREHDFLFDEVRTIEVRTCELLKQGEQLRVQFPGPNADNIKDRCFETDEKLRNLAIAIDKRGSELDALEELYKFRAQSNRVINGIDELITELDTLSMFDLDTVDQLIKEIAVKGQVRLQDIDNCIDKGHQLIETKSMFANDIQKKVNELEGRKVQFDKTLHSKRQETEKALQKRYFEKELADINDKAINWANKLSRMSCSEFAVATATAVSLASAGTDPMRVIEVRLTDASAALKALNKRMDDIAEKTSHMPEMKRQVDSSGQLVEQAFRVLATKRNELNQAKEYRALVAEASELENWLETKAALLRRATQELERISQDGDAARDVEERIAHLRRFQSVQSEMRFYETKYNDVIRMANDVMNGVDEKLSAEALNHKNIVEKGWQTLLRLLSHQSKALEDYRQLLRFMELCLSIETWVDKRRSTIVKGEVGDDYEHCIKLLTEIQIEAEVDGDVINNSSEISAKIAEVTELGGILASNPEISGYVRDRADKVNDLWSRLDALRTDYFKRLQIAKEGHEFVMNCDQLIGQLRNIDSFCTADLSGYNQSELEIVQRKQNVVERELLIVQNQLERLEGSAEHLASRCPPLSDVILSRNEEASNLLEQVSDVRDRRIQELKTLIEVCALSSEISKLSSFAARNLDEMREELRPQNSMEAQSVVDQHSQRGMEIEVRKPDVNKVLKKAQKLSLEEPSFADVSERFQELGPASQRLEDIWQELNEEWELRRDLYDQHKNYQLFLQFEAIAEQWIRSKLPLPTDLGSSMSSAEQLLQDHQKAIKTMESQSIKIDDLVSHFQDRIPQDHFAYGELNERLTRVQEKFNDLTQACGKRLMLLEDSKRYQAWMTACGELLDWISERLELLDDTAGRSATALTDLSGISARLRHQISIESEVNSHQELQDKLLRRGLVLSGDMEATNNQIRVLNSEHMVNDVAKRCIELKNSWEDLQRAIQSRREMLDDAKKISQAQADCDRLLRWITETENHLDQEDYRMLDNNDAVESSLKRHDNLEDEVAFRKNQLAELADIVDELRQRGHGLAKDVADSVADLQERIENLNEPMAIHRNNLKDALALCNLRRDIARELVWVANRAELAINSNFGDNMAHVITLKKRHENLRQEIDHHDQFIEELGRRADVLMARQREAAADLSQRLQNLTEGLARLKQAADDRLKRLEEALQSHRFYAELNDSVNWINAKQTTLQETVSNVREDSVYDIAGQLDLINQETSEYQSTVQDVENLANTLIQRRHFDSSNIELQKRTLIQTYSDLCDLVDKHCEDIAIRQRLFSVRRHLRDAHRQASDWLRVVQSDECGRDLEQCESIMGELQELIKQIELGEMAMDELCRQASEFEAMGDPELLQQLGYLGQLRASVHEWVMNRQTMLENAMKIHSFLREADDTIAWIADKEPCVFSDNMGHDLNTVQHLYQKHVSIERDLQALNRRMDALHKNAENLSQNFPEAQDRIADKYTKAANNWSGLVQQWQLRKEELEYARKLQRFLTEYRRVVSWFYDTYKRMTVDVTTADIEAMKVINAQHDEFKSELHNLQDVNDKFRQSGEELSDTAVSDETRRLVGEKMDNVQECLVKSWESWRNRKIEYESRISMLMMGHDMMEIETWLAKHESTVRMPSTSISVEDVDEKVAMMNDLILSMGSIKPRITALKQYRPLTDDCVTDRQMEQNFIRRLSQMRHSEDERVTRDRKKRDERRRTGEVSQEMVQAAMQQQRRQKQQQQQPKPAPQNAQTVPQSPLPSQTVKQEPARAPQQPQQQQQQQPSQVSVFFSRLAQYICFYFACTKGGSLLFYGRKWILFVQFFESFSGAKTKWLPSWESGRKPFPTQWLPSRDQWLQYQRLPYQWLSP